MRKCWGAACTHPIEALLRCPHASRGELRDPFGYRQRAAAGPQTLRWMPSEGFTSGLCDVRSRRTSSRSPRFESFAQDSPTSPSG
jgi:hypothetical protein